MSADDIAAGNARQSEFYRSFTDRGIDPFAPSGPDPGDLDYDGPDPDDTDDEGEGCPTCPSTTPEDRWTAGDGISSGSGPCIDPWHDDAMRSGPAASVAETGTPDLMGALQRSLAEAKERRETRSALRQRRGR